MAHFKIVGSVSDVETIATGQGIRELRRLRKAYGGTKWRKMKGFGTVEFPSGKVKEAELHWYEAHGVGRKEYKIKRFLK